MDTRTLNPIQYRRASQNDAPLLAEWNHQLIRDEGHSNPMTVSQLEARMRGWLRDEYTGILFHDTTGRCGYALYREERDLIHLRHFFVVRERRREHLGSRMMDLLKTRIWTKPKRILVDCLTKNAPGMAFWKSTGFSDYCLTLEIPAERR